MLRNFTFLLALLFSIFDLSGQKMVYDSLVINFGNCDVTQINARVDTIRDLRIMPHNCVAINEMTKYAFIPVDNLVITKKLLSKEIANLFYQKPEPNFVNKYQLEINEFIINTKKELFKTSYTCNVAISVYSIDTSMNRHFSGILLYENNASYSPRKKNLKLGYEKIIDTWKTQFISDFKKINSCYGVDPNCQLSNYRNELHAAKKNMLINTETIIGANSWLVDGEIIFSRPEAQKSFFRQAYSLRYRNEKKYEAFETSLYNNQNYQRVSDAFLFALKSKFFIGINRWKENEYKNHGLEDVLLLDFSFSQNIVWNRLFKNGITLGIGVMENLTYIYSNDFTFKPYAVVQFGVKL
jgi:hypothetical protein